jgi:hypothetical protein
MMMVMTAACCAAVAIVVVVVSSLLVVHFSSTFASSGSGSGDIGGSALGCRQVGLSQIRFGGCHGFEGTNDPLSLYIYT